MENSGLWLDGRFFSKEELEKNEKIQEDLLAKEDKEKEKCRQDLLELYRKDKNNIEVLGKIYYYGLRNRSFGRRLGFKSTNIKDTLYCLFHITEEEILDILQNIKEKFGYDYVKDINIHDCGIYNELHNKYYRKD